jgi:hypothetical protein
VSGNYPITVVNPAPGGGTSASQEFQVAFRYHYIPTVFNNWINYFLSPNEIEDNDTVAQANGPLVFGSTYQGTPADDYDYFSVILTNSCTLTASLTGYTPEKGQLQLWNASNSSLYDYDYDKAEMVVTSGAPLPSGLYYVRVATVQAYYSSDTYNLVVTCAP